MTAPGWIDYLRVTAAACGWLEERASSIDVVFVQRDAKVRVVLVEGGGFGGAWRTLEGAGRSSFTTMPELVECWLVPIPVER
jgi:hypothetical protein